MTDLDQEDARIEKTLMQLLHDRRVRRIPTQITKLEYILSKFCLGEDVDVREFYKKIVVDGPGNDRYIFKIYDGGLLEKETTASEKQLQRREFYASVKARLEEEQRRLNRDNELIDILTTATTALSLRNDQELKAD